jgi:predicted nucleic acid-binding protein
VESLRSQHARRGESFGARLTGQLVSTRGVIAELDHLVGRDGEAIATKPQRENLGNSAYHVEWRPTAMLETITVAEAHESMQLGLTDASLLALAARVQSSRIATLEERYLRAVKPPSGDAFTLLPTDAR